MPPRSSSAAASSARSSIFWMTTAALMGSIIYRLAVFFALRAGFAPTDLKAVTAILVIVALSVPTCGKPCTAFATGAAAPRA